MSGVEEFEGSAALRAMLQNEGRGVLVDFWSPWCAPCRTMRPHLNRMADERNARWRFVAVNADANQATAEEFDVRSLPTLVYFRDGEEAFRFSGAAAMSSIEGKLDELEDSAISRPANPDR